MGTINDLFEDFEALNLKEELPNLIQATSYEIDRLVISQLQKGELSTGDQIQPRYASNYYAKKKQKMNPAPGYGIPDLSVTGNYYKGIGVSVTKDEYDIESNVEYADADSITQYGPNLLALTDENKEAYCNDTLQPAIQDFITEKTGLTFQ